MLSPISAELSWDQEEEACNSEASAVKMGEVGFTGKPTQTCKKGSFIQVKAGQVLE